MCGYSEGATLSASMKEAVISSTNYTEKEPSSQAKKKEPNYLRTFFLSTQLQGGQLLWYRLSTQRQARSWVEPESVNHRKPAYDLIRDK